MKPSTEVAHEIFLKQGTDTATPTYLPVEISFDVVSEDLGDDLQAFVLLDFKGFQSSDFPRSVCEIAPVRAGTLNTKPDRNVSCPVELNSAPSVPVGCHTFTAVVSHLFSPLPFRPVKPEDVGAETWFYQVGVDATIPASEVQYYPCRPGPRPGDGGADARTDGGGL